jgi:hypothetical protein
MATRPTVLCPFPQGNSPIPRPIPNSVQSVALTANVAVSITVPNTSATVPPAKYVIFSCTGNFYVHCFTTATVPGTITDGSAPELNPTAYQLPANDVTTISVISPVACVLTAAFYA